MENLNSKNEECINKKELVFTEAALYVAGRPLGLQTIGKITGIRSKDKILKTAECLKEKYQSYNSPIEILELKKHRFVMQLKPEYSHKIRKLSLQSMLTKGPLRTLSFIAYYQPILQTKVAEARGSHAYQHMKLLEEQNLVQKQITGRTKTVRTTPFFADYFGLSHDLGALKRQVKNMFKQE